MGGYFGKKGLTLMKLIESLIAMMPSQEFCNLGSPRVFQVGKNGLLWLHSRRIIRFGAVERVRAAIFKELCSALRMDGGRNKRSIRRRTLPGLYMGLCPKIQSSN